MQILKSIKDLRRELGLTQDKLAAALKITQPMLSRYETDLAPSIWMKKKIVDFARKYGFEIELENAK